MTTNNQKSPNGDGDASRSDRSALRPESDDMIENFGVPSADDPWNSAQLELMVTLRLGDASADQTKREAERLRIREEERAMARRLLDELRKGRQQRLASRRQG